MPPAKKVHPGLLWKIYMFFKLNQEKITFSKMEQVRELCKLKHVLESKGGVTRVNIF